MFQDNFLRLKLALLKEISMCWNVDISRNGWNLAMHFIPSISIPSENKKISLSGMQEKVLRDFHQCWQVAYPTGISMNPTGARKYRLTRGKVRRLSCMSGRRLWRFDVILHVLTPFWRHFLPNVSKITS